MDVIVVGGRCAGAVTGLLLARAGLDVLVVERAVEGSDVISGQMIKPDGVDRLARWGVLPDLLATGCPPITAADMTIADHRELRITSPSEGMFPLAPRRWILDRLLQEHARRAGARVRCSTTFHGRRGNLVTLTDSSVRTRLLIGADGRRSAVAKSVGAPFTDRRAGRTCAWYGYWDHPLHNGLRAELRHGTFAGAFPTHAQQTLAFIQLPVTAWRRGHGAEDLQNGLRSCPSVNAALHGARQSGPVVGVRDLPTHFRRAAGADWALVGDAAHHKDPLAARGIADALLGAQLLTDHILCGWDGDLTDTLRTYAAELQRILRPTSDLNDQLARLDLPADQMLDTWRALQAAEQELHTNNRARSDSPIRSPTDPHDRELNHTEEPT